MKGLCRVCVSDACDWKRAQKMVERAFDEDEFHTIQDERKPSRAVEHR